MKTKSIFIKFLFLIVSFCFPIFSWAQETTGSIEGIVKDSSGAVVPNVTVTITTANEVATETTTTGKGAGFRRTITTNEDGFFRVLQVPPGTYNVVTTATSGFGEANYNNVTVAVGQSTQLDIVVNPGGTVNTVNVAISDAPPVDTTSNAIQTTINAQKIELIPKGTGFAGLLRTVPGTRPESRSGGYSVDGASGGENVFVIDGQEVTNFRTGTLNETYNIPTQLVQEVQVKSSGFEAQFGGATGGVVSVVTRGGNNDFHGEFGIQFGLPKFNGNPRPDLYRFTSGSVTTNNFVQTAELIAAPKTGGTDAYYTANLSGPIIKNRVWFFTSYSPQVFNTNVNALYYTSAPAATRTFRASEPYSRKTKYEYGFARIDANPFNNLRLTGTFLWNPVIQQGEILNTLSFTNGTDAVPTAVYGGSIGTLRGNQYASQRGGRQTSNVVTFSGVYTPWNNVVIEGRYNRGYLNEKLGNYFVPIGIGITACTGTQPAGFGCATQTGGSLTVKDISIRETYEFNGTYIFNAGGRHELKGGYQRYKTFNDVQQGNNAIGSLSFNFSSDLNALLGITKTPGAIGYGIFSRGGTFGTGTSLSQGIFIQDKYQPFRRLTLNLGVRTEKETLPSFNEIPSNLNFDWSEKIAPRLGFALDIFGDGKTKAFASYGRFFDRVKFYLPRGLFGGTIDLRDYFEVFPGDTVAKFNINTIVNGFTGPSPCPASGFITTGALSRCQENRFISANGPGASPFANGGAIDTNAKPFQQTEFTVGVERQLSQNYLMRVRYTLKNLDETIEDAQVIPITGSTANVVGNPGEGLLLQLLQQEGYPKAAKAQRRYDGLEFVIEKRLSNNWYFNANYTYSRLYGNYTGLASSDEPHLTGGRTAPGGSRAFDVPLIGYTVYGEPDNGRLPTDRPHVFNIYGAYIFDWMGNKSNSTEISGFQTITSGTLQTTYLYSSSSTTPQILYGRGDLGRSPVYSQTDLAVTHRYRFGRDNRFTVAFDVNISNLFDQDTVTSIWTQPNVGQVYEAALNTQAGFPAMTRREFNINWQNGTLLPRILSYINERPDRQDARYKQPFTFQGPRTVRFGFRFLF